MTQTLEPETQAKAIGDGRLELSHTDLAKPQQLVEMATVG
jgi:hypothetical protein